MSQLRNALMMSKLRNALILALALTTTGLAVQTTRLATSLTASAERIEQHLRLQGFHNQLQQSNAMLSAQYLRVLSEAQLPPCPTVLLPRDSPRGATCTSVGDPKDGEWRCVHDTNQ